VREIEIDDQVAIQKACDLLALPLSEYNFSNLYLFRKAHNYKLHEIGSDLSVVGTSYDKQTFLMPLFHPKNWKEFFSSAKKLGADYLFPISEQWWPEIEQEGLSIMVKEDESDYLYETEAIRMCKGRHLSNHRNIVRQFLSTYDVSCTRYRPELLKDVLTIIHNWADEKETPADIDPFIEGLQCAEKLLIKGWVFYADSQPVGCLFGQPLSKDIYLYHFSKALSHYWGLAQYMRQRTAEDISFTYLNWEQDLGILGLRQFKRSYRPIQMLQKGRASLKR